MKIGQKMTDFSKWDVRNHIPVHLWKVIRTPHEHEGAENKPLWLIWKMKYIKKTGKIVGPVLDCVCDSESSAVYNTGAACEEAIMTTRDKIDVFVERIPANHRFASSIVTEMMKMASRHND